MCLYISLKKIISSRTVENVSSVPVVSCYQDYGEMNELKFWSQKDFDDYFKSVTHFLSYQTSCLNPLSPISFLYKIISTL